MSKSSYSILDSESFAPDGFHCVVLWRRDALDCRVENPPETCNGATQRYNVFLYATANIRCPWVVAWRQPGPFQQRKPRSPRCEADASPPPRGPLRILVDRGAEGPKGTVERPGAHGLGRPRVNTDRGLGHSTRRQVKCPTIVCKSILMSTRKHRDIRPSNP